jgi:predicted nucleic acid-binding protein
VAKLVVDSGVVLRLAAEKREATAKHKLLAPTLLRSQVLSALHEAVHARKLAQETARERLAHFNRMPIRLLGDASLRQRAWKVADELGWAETYTAEYVALTQLQGDAFVTLDKKLARVASRLVEVVAFEALGVGSERPGIGTKGRSRQ